MATAQDLRRPGAAPDEVAVAKKKGEGNTRQVNVRFTESVYARLDAASKVLGIDLAQLVRNSVHKQLPHLERQAEEIRLAEGRDDG